MDLFLTQIFISQNMNSLTEVMLWIIVVFLSAVCTLILSHLLQRVFTKFKLLNLPIY